MTKFITGHVYKHPGNNAGPTIYMGPNGEGGPKGYDLRGQCLWQMDWSPFSKDLWEPTGATGFVFQDTRPFDGYIHYFIRHGRKFVILAGCRRFTTIRDAQDHWNSRFRKYHDEVENQRRNDWSLKFIARAQAAYRKKAKAPAKPRKPKKKVKRGAAKEAARRTHKR